MEEWKVEGGGRERERERERVKRDRLIYIPIIVNHTNHNSVRIMFTFVKNNPLLLNVYMY